MVRYRFLDLKSNADFKDLPQDYKSNVRAWYSYNWKLNHREKEYKVPKTLTPNLLLVGLFKDAEVDLKTAQHLASLLERFAEKPLLAQIASNHIKKAISLIDDINDAKKVNMTIGALWGPI